MKESFIPIKKFSEEPYSNILGYPQANTRQINSRLKELERMGIQKISFQGTTQLGKLRVLGKGYVGVVILAKKNGKVFALKIRRTDAQRNKMHYEAKLLQTANKVRVGPQLIDFSNNFILMEFISGKRISDWIRGLKGKGTAKTVKSTIRKILEDCRKLDEVGFDHGELSRISKHVIVGKKISLIDFESGSMKRRVANVTSATQAIFIGSGLSKILHKIYKISPKADIIKSLQAYKGSKSRNSFENLLVTLRL